MIQPRLLNGSAAPAVVRMATSAGIRMPSSGMESSSMTSPSASPSRAAGRLYSGSSHSVMWMTVWASA